MDDGEVDWARYLLGACSSGDPLRQAVVRNHEQVRRLRAENADLRARITTGGPPAPFTPGWERGDSSRPPTAPPEPTEVNLP